MATVNCEDLWRVLMFWRKFLRIRDMLLEGKAV